MKLLIFSDIHLHLWNYGSTLVDGMNSRLLAQAKVLDDIAQYTADSPVDHIVFCGDLFHQHGKIDAAVLKVAYEGITKIMESSGVHMDMLVGNHDTGMKDMSVHSMHWLDSIPKVRVIDRPIHNVGQDQQFSFLPYTEDEAVLKKFLAEANELCFMHQGMVDVPMASGFVINEILNQDMIPDHVQHVFTGHYHPFTQVSDKATVVGSVMQHNWADQNDPRGWLIVDTDTLSMEQVHSHAPEFQALNMGGADILGNSDEGSGWWAARLNNNFIRVTDFNEATMGELRKELLDIGARSVDFVISSKSYKQTVVKAITGKGLSVPELVREYEKQHSVSEARRKVGKELMK